MNNIPFQEWTEQPAQLALTSSEAKSFVHAERSYQAAAGEPSDPPSNQKMAIPRLAEGTDSTFTSPGRFHRRHVSRACESCRQRKTKCTGDRNGCRNCREAGIICCYTDGKREKSKRQLASLEAKLEQYEYAFNRLSRRFNVSAEQLMSIASSLETPSEQTPQHPDSFSIDNRNLFQVPEQATPFRLTSTMPEHTTEDFNKDASSQATGFIGGSSEVNWLQQLAQEFGNGEYANIPNDITQLQSLVSPVDIPISKLSYYLDDWDLPTVRDLDVYEIPPRAAANHLYETYIDSVHSSFPIIGTATFGSQFRNYYTDQTLKPGPKWLAILNLIFAIGAKYSYIIGEFDEHDIDPHHVYFSRAKVLAIDTRSFDHLDLQQLQIEGLAALYFLALGQLNRSWKLCGNAARGAMSLGLHLCMMGSFISDTAKEIRYRLWWSIYALEHRLSLMTGRPSCICDNACTTPLPIPFDEDDFQHEEVKQVLRRMGNPGGQFGRVSSSLIDPEINDMEIGLQGSRLAAVSPRASLFFLQVIKLASISRRMMSKLYNPEGMQAPRPSKEFIIRGLMIEMDSWCMGLPKEYDFTSTSTSTKTPMSLANQRTSLALLYYSTKIGITRPCLESPNSNHDSEPSGKVSDFYERTAVECVEAGCHLLRLFPEPPDATALYKVSPWWCVIHFLMQATVIIYMELAYDSQHVPEKAEMVKNAATKSYEWLTVMCKTSQTSRKARKLCERLLEHLGIHLDISPDFGYLSDEEGLYYYEGTAKVESTASSPTSGLTHSPGTTSSNGLDTTGGSDAMDTTDPSNHDASYDAGYLPYDPSTGQLTGSFFPGEGSPDLALGYYWSESM